MTPTVTRSPRHGHDEQSIVIFPTCDPLGLMKDTFLSRSLATVRAEDLLLAWLLSLPDELDPALAARPILDVLPVHIAADATGNRPRLAQLLGEISRWPRARLRAEGESRRRRARSA